MPYIKYCCIVLLCLAMIVLNTGCWDMKLYEEIGFILQFGLENDQNGNLIVSMTSPVVSPEAKEKAEVLFNNSETLIRSSREMLRNKAGKMLQGGKTQHIVFSKDLAMKGGIFEYLEVFIRNPENPMLANVVVVDGSPKEMMELNLKFTNKPRPAYYLADLLQDARRRSIVPEMRIYNFSIGYYSGTIDPVTPYIRYDDKSIEVIGAALFSGDKMTGSIGTRQAMLLNTLMGKSETFEFAYEKRLPDEREGVRKQGAALMMRDSKRKISIDTEGGIPVININIRFKAFVDEYAGKNRLIEPEAKKEIEYIIANDITEQTMKLLKYLQRVGSDPIGFGEQVRAYHNKYWKSVNWKEVYKDAEFQVDADVLLESYGAIE